MTNTTLPRVSVSSLPSSLCHNSPAEALKDALALVSLLQCMGNLRSQSSQQEADSGNIVRGQVLVLALLTDKTRIASGDLAFPLCAAASEPAAPSLVELLVHAHNAKHARVLNCMQESLNALIFVSAELQDIASNESIVPSVSMRGLSHMLLRSAGELRAVLEQSHETAAHAARGW